MHKHERTYRCEAGHCFDEAREGYVNLLPANRKRSREPGDNREMIEARKRVHAAEVYRPLAQEIAVRLAEWLPASPRVLDLGCGEGYYSGVLLQRLADMSLWGIDIAKPAVRLAAKAHHRGKFAVASAFAVPLPDASLDGVFTVFAPASDAELARLLPPGGLYLNVCPAAGHLWELRQQLYAQPRPHREEVAALPGLVLESQDSVEFAVTLAPELLEDLVAMTPYAYGGERESKAQLSALGEFKVQMAFLLQRYRREKVA
ncbi:23S rRNA (guanine(745)-N(1))-methyltransferase [Halioglobus japonicus]|nr:hypothetical protein A3709_12130 [Halioglobus sp. HI00S01]GHD12963.1 23S rRNA (guanine(745)-N(1))-methyltransferase [Halioglobus japonicus]